MSDLGPISQLGIGAATLVILWLVVKYFMATLDKKDQVIMKLVEDFRNTIDRNTKIGNEASKKQTVATSRLAKAITKLEKKIDHQLG